MAEMTDNNNNNYQDWETTSSSYATRRLKTKSNIPDLISCWLQKNNRDGNHQTFWTKYTQGLGVIFK